MTIEKLNQRIEELKAANVADQKELEKMGKDYEKAVNNFESEKIDSLHSKITAVKSALENRLKQIAILVSPDNPLRIKAKAEHFKKIEDERNAAKDKAEAVHEKLMQAQADYIAMANEIYKVNEEYRLANVAYHNASGTMVPSGPYLLPTKYEVSTGTDRHGRNYHFKGGIN